MPADSLLDKYADVAVRIGVGLQAGDRLLVRSTTGAVELTRRVVEKAAGVQTSSSDSLGF